MTIQTEKDILDLSLGLVKVDIDAYQDTYFQSEGRYKQMIDVDTHIPNLPAALVGVCQVHVYHNPNPGMGHGYTIRVEKELPTEATRIRRQDSVGSENRTHGWKEETLDE